MNPRLIFGLLGLVLAGGLAAFGLDARNQAAMRQIVANLAAEKPTMQDVAFKVPFLPDREAAKKRAYPGLYPSYFTWGTDVKLQYYDLGEGYWQTNGINLNDGHEIRNDDQEYRAHLRFKFNPDSDPIHPGHSLLAVDSSQHALRFAKLGQVDFDQVKRIPDAKWIKTAPNEQPAVWHLQPGDVVGVMIDAVEAESDEATAGAKPKAPRHHHFVAKLRIAKLSHESVRFDYVYRNDGKADFPPPAYPPDDSASE